MKVYLHTNTVVVAVIYSIFITALKFAQYTCSNQRTQMAQNLIFAMDLELSSTHHCGEKQQNLLDNNQQIWL